MPLSSRLVLNVLLCSTVLGLGAQARGAGEAAPAAPAAAAPAAPAAVASAAGDPARGKDLSYTCLGCHGIKDYKNVYPTYSVPELVGQHPGYILAALQEYKSGQRAHGTMHQQAASLSDQDMQDIASYFGTPPLNTSAAPVGTAPVKAALCASCHGKNGVGITTDYPNLAGQHADYIARSLVEYAHGDRKNPIMPNFVTGLSDSDIEDISNYYSKQTPGLRTLARRQSFLSPK